MKINKQKVCTGCKHEPYSPKYCDCCSSDSNNFERKYINNKCEYCGCTDGIHKSDCYFILKLP